MTGFWIGFLFWPALLLAFVLVVVLMYQFGRWQRRRQRRRRDRETIDAAITESAHALRFPTLSKEAHNRIWDAVKESIEKARGEPFE